MTNKEQEAYDLIKKHKPETIADLARLMEITRQRASVIVASLTALGKVDYRMAHYEVRK